ncbi:MAG: DUF7619 domain-containing protein, partial [Bacteroidota bacterium]
GTFNSTETIESTGSFTIAEGTTLDYNRGRHALAAGAEVMGNGTFSNSGATIINEARFSPGLSVGRLTYSGDFRMDGPDATLSVEIAGTTAGVTHDVLSVTGAASLGGTLAVTTSPSFSPEHGTRFDILTTPPESELSGFPGSFEGLVDEDRDLVYYPSIDEGVLRLEAAGVPVLASEVTAEPLALSSGGFRAVTVSGAGFTPDARVVLECQTCVLPEDYGRIPGRFRAVAPDEMTIEFDLRPPDIAGTYDLVVTNPRGGRAETSLTISPAEALAFSVYAADTLAREAGRVAGTFVVRANRPVDVATAVPFQISGTAMLYADYLLDVLDTSVVIGSGEQEARVRVIPLSDDLEEELETVIMTLLHPATYPPRGSAVVSVKDGPASDEFDVAASFPREAGEASTVMLRAVGQALTAGATMRLERGATIVEGRDPQVNEGGTILSAVFEIPPSAQGEWNVVVENADGSSVTLAAALAVVPHRDQAFHVELTGPRQFRREIPPQRYYVTVSNRGTSDAIGVPVWVVVSKRGLNGFAVLEPEFDVVMPAPPEEAGVTSWTDPSLGEDALSTVIETDTDLVLAFLVPVLPAGASVSFPFRARTYNIKAWANEAFFEGYPTEEQASKLAERLFKDPEFRPLLAAAAGGSAQMASCILSVTGFILSTTPLGRCFDVVRGTLIGIGVGMLGIPVSMSASAVGMSTAGAAASLVSGALACSAAANPALAAASFAASVVSGGLNIAAVAMDCGPFFDPKPQRDLDVDEIRAVDPNDKLGPSGGLADDASGPRYVTGLDPFGYLIRFENMPEATAPALEVLIEDRLDPERFDLSSFSFGPITFAEQTVDLPPGLQRFQRTVPVENTPYSVIITGDLDTATGALVWRFSTIDTETGGLPSDLMAGFLPPNKTSPEGEGSVFFTVNAHESLTDGTEITNWARIYFDLADPIDTPVWSNMIDRNPPESRVEELAEEQTDFAFPVTWSGTDAGSGIAYYSVFVSEDGGSYRLWRHAPANEVSGIFTGTAGKEYAFYGVAFDRAGNGEATPSAPQATTRVGDVAVVAGDVSGEGAIDLADVDLLMRHVIRDTTLIGRALAASDVSAQDEVTAYDASLLLRFIDGSVTCLPAQGDCASEALPDELNALAWEAAEGLGTPHPSGSESLYNRFAVPLRVDGGDTPIYAFEIAVPLDNMMLENVDVTLPSTWIYRHGITDGTLYLAAAGPSELSAATAATLTLSLPEAAASPPIGGTGRVNEATAAAITGGIRTPIEPVEIPVAFALEQNYPNPFNPSTTIRFHLPQAVDVQLHVVDALGRRVAKLADGGYVAGTHTVTWDAETMASGVYFYVIRAGLFSDVRRMVLIK